MERNSTELCDALRRQTGVFLVPGDCYGLDQHIRIGIGVPTATLREGLALAGEFFRGAASR
jgi:aspartate/methionine/tyrosine aminotransferase